LLSATKVAEGSDNPGIQARAKEAQEILAANPQELHAADVEQALTLKGKMAEGKPENLARLDAEAEGMLVAKQVQEIAKKARKRKTRTPVAPTTGSKQTVTYEIKSDSKLMAEEILKIMRRSFGSWLDSRKGVKSDVVEREAANIWAIVAEATVKEAAAARN
jgi:hypothetical protein